MSAQTQDAWADVAVNSESGLLEISLEDGSVSLEFDCSIEAQEERLSLAEAIQAGQAQAADDASLSIVAQWPHLGLEWSLHWQVTADQQTVICTSELINTSDQPIKLGEARVVEVGEESGAVTLAGDDGQAVYLHQAGAMCLVAVKRAAVEASQCWHFLHLVSQAAKRTLHLGFITLDRQSNFHRFTYDTQVQTLASVCDFEGWELPAGETISLATLAIEARADEHASLHTWAERVAAYHQPVFPEQTIGGWLGWSWVDAFNYDSYEAVVLRNVKAIRERLPGVDVGYVWVSIGNIKDGLPGNWLEWDTENFPSGHQYLIDELGSLDFKLGLWAGAFWICGAAEDKMARMKDSFLRTGGEPTIGSSRWNYGAMARRKPEDRPANYSLDPTHPETEAFLREVFQTYYQWGIRYYMEDFTNAISGTLYGSAYDEYHDRSYLPGPQLYRRGLQIVREAAGPDTYLLSSSGPTLQNVGLVDASRIGGDYGEGRGINPESYFYPATFVTNKPDFWTSHRPASTNLATTYYTHRRLFINDSNVLTLDRPISLNEAQIVATIFGLSGGPVMLGDDIETIGEDRLALIRKVFPRTPEIATPVDLFERPEPDYARIFHLRAAADWDAWDIVGVINYDADPFVTDLKLERLGLVSDAEYRIFELWSEQSLGLTRDSLRVVVPPCSARLYRISRARQHPWVLGTNMHVLQGATELQSVTWNPETLSLSGSVQRYPGETGYLYVTAPSGWAVVDPRGWHLAKDGGDDSLLMSRRFDLENGATTFDCRFSQV